VDAASQGSLLAGIRNASVERLLPVLQDVFQVTPVPTKDVPLNKFATWPEGEK
jgi:hypothetical protein